jgi:hypothetical protein
MFCIYMQSIEALAGIVMEEQVIGDHKAGAECFFARDAVLPLFVQVLQLLIPNCIHSNFVYNGSPRCHRD